MVPAFRPLRAGFRDVRVRNDQGDSYPIPSAFAGDAGDTCGGSDVERTPLDDHRIIAGFHAHGWPSGDLVGHAVFDLENGRVTRLSLEGVAQ